MDDRASGRAGVGELPGRAADVARAAAAAAASDDAIISQSR